MSTSASVPPPIPANDFQALWREVEPEVMAAVKRVGESGWYILGREVRAFEAALASFWGLPHAVGCGNGMDAIEISLRAGGLVPGEKVLTTPLSAFATTLAILRAGGVPVFVDVDAGGQFDFDEAERYLKLNPEVRWMVPVHLFGRCLNLDRMEALQEKYHLKIIEDCAQSIGASWNGRPCGTVGFAATTSFYPTKNLGAMGDGGALLTKDAALDQAARQWRDYGQSEKYVHALPGLNSRLDELQAAILAEALLPRLEKFTQARGKIAATYLAGITHPLVEMLAPAPNSRCVNHLFPVLVNGSRDSFMAHLRSCCIMGGIHYPQLIPDQPAMVAGSSETFGALPMAKRMAEREVSLPIHPHLTDEQVARVIQACNSWNPAV